MFRILPIVAFLGMASAFGDETPSLGRAAAPATSSTAASNDGAQLSAEEETQQREEVVRLLGELDSDQFEVRSKAASRIEELASRPELGRLLASEFQRVLVRSDVSFEVRCHLRRWSRVLPNDGEKPMADATDDELDRVVRQLDDDSYAVRLGAAQRLEWLLGNPKLICPLMLRLKRLLADAKPTVGKEGEVESAWRRAHSAWLLSDPADWALPAVTDAEFLQWIDDLASPSPQGETSGAWRVYRTAERELMDALARDEIAPRIAKALETRLASETDAEAKSRLQTVFDMTKPEMVAEYWQGRRHLSEQHLLVGVPATYPGAPNPTHFDRVDDETAHCVSGNSLSPGDYPVGVAIPHPMQASAIFHLVNLPTPRRRQAYLCYAQIDDAKRLTEISRRTLDRFLEKKSLLTAAELLMLGQLDPTEVSRFAGKYFHAVDDAPLQQLLPLAQLPDPRIRRMGPRPSRFGAICGQLAVDGVKEAMPGLTDAIAKKRFLPPTNTAPYRLEWLAAFSIAVRDPWPEVDAWLADQVDHHELLAQGRQLTKSPEIGATAAALLLKRQGQLPASFGLEPAKEDVTIEQLRIEGYRFAGEESRDRVKAWIAKKNEK